MALLAVFAKNCGIHVAARSFRIVGGQLDRIGASLDVPWTLSYGLLAKVLKYVTCRLLRATFCLRFGSCSLGVFATFVNDADKPNMM